MNDLDQLLASLGADCVRVVLESTPGPTAMLRTRCSVRVYRCDHPQYHQYAGDFGGVFATEHDAREALIAAGFGGCGFLGAPSVRVNGRIAKPKRCPSDGHAFGQEDMWAGDWVRPGEPNWR